MRRDLPSIARALGAFLVTVGIGFVFLPKDSVWFWATEFFRSDRGGAHEFFRNQAVTGLLARLGAQGMLKDAIWLLIVAMIIAAAAYAGHRFTRSGGTCPRPRGSSRWRRCSRHRSRSLTTGCTSSC